MLQTAAAASTVTVVAAVAAIVTAVAAAVVPRLTLQYYAPPNLTDTFPPFSFPPRCKVPATGNCC
jgi:hypothetical protein